MDKTSIKTASSTTGFQPSVASSSTSAPGATPDIRRSRPGPVKQFLSVLASLRVTVVLFALSLILVFAGTLAQIDYGIWTVVAKYFRSFFVWIPFQIFFPRDWHIPGGFPFVGGYIIGGALLINLLAAHAVRFKLSWKRSGILLLHSGLIVMMLGELVTGLFAVEARMTIPEGSARSFVEEIGKVEITFTRPVADDPKLEDTIAIPNSKLRSGADIKNDKLPCDVVIDKYLPNSELVEKAPRGVTNLATAGDGLSIFAVEKQEAAGVDTNQSIDIPSAYVTFKDKTTGASLGTYLLSVEFYAFQDRPQHVTIDDKTYDVYLRFKRIFKPYTITLNKFSHDLYDGTDIPKNYSSDIRLQDPSQKEDRDVKIWMNHPLRYDGDTLYQADFLKGSQKGTILQVVRNPGWTMPYISCTMVVLGMLIHFGITLIGFIRAKVAPALVGGSSSNALNGKRISKSDLVLQGLDWSTWGLVALALVMALGYLLVVMLPPSSPANGFNYVEAGKIAVKDGGRSKPLDSVARAKLMSISGKQTFLDNNKEEHSATEWLLDVMTSRVSKNGMAESYKVFRIENDQVLDLLKLPEKPGSYRYSIDEISGKEQIGKLQEEAERARQIDPKNRKLFDAKVVELAQRIQLYITLSSMEAPQIIDPVTPGEKPKTLREALDEMRETNVENPQTVAFTTLLEAYIKKDVPKFNSTVEEYRATQTKKDSWRTGRGEWEAFFNHFAPFYHCMVLYVIIIVLSAVSWLVFQKPLNRIAFWLMALTLVVHTIALVGRMIIQERPPVTNLYSSAIFIGWAAVWLLLIIEVFFPYSIATFLGGIIGFCTLLIAHFLSLDGDTMEMLQAVLDTNFWLATHVTAVTIGYAATFVAGFLGILYIVASIWNNATRALDRKLFTDVANYMLYGVICFAMLFSFTGTVLGGIWADQSWGRFWGWDPKENGALMIVIWNALILHARWSGLVKARGMAVLAVFGNIMTAWSWFGVNMLGIGLHSYGFMEGARIVLSVWIVSQLGIMVLGMIPALHEWQWTPDPKNKLKSVAL